MKISIGLGLGIILAMQAQAQEPKLSQAEQNNIQKLANDKIKDASNMQLDLLQGDQKDVCEALLCLSSPQRPSECSPSLKKYFSIKKPGDRAAFLNKCPKQ